MIPHVAELNRVLLTAEALFNPKSKIVSRATLLTECKSVVIEGRMPNHEDTIDFSIGMGLMREVGSDKIQITSNGEVFLNLNPRKFYDLTSEQKKYLVRVFFLDGELKRPVKECFRCFVPSEKRKTFIWSEIDGTPLGENYWVVSHLEQLGIVRRVKSGYAVKAEYVDTIDVFINEPKGFTEDQLLEYLKEKKKLGDTAEQIVLDFERSRLRQLGHRVEAECVKPVAKIKVDAGYDIESFNGKSKSMRFDRFIEVKGSGEPKLRFVWSTSEMKVAEKLGEQYWIYYQGGIDKKTGTSKYKPIMIQDPIRTLQTDARFIKQENGVVVTASISGEKI